MISRKSRYSNLLLTDEEHHVIFHLEKSLWMSEPKTISITKKVLLGLSLDWVKVLNELERKGRIKNIHFYKTKVSLEIIPAPPPIPFEREPSTTF